MRQVPRRQEAGQRLKMSNSSKVDAAGASVESSAKQPSPEVEAETRRADALPLTAGGEEAAWAGVSVLATEFSGLLKMIILRYTRDVAVTEDLIQEVFLKVYKALVEGRVTVSEDKASELKPWLNRIAVNTALDWLRRIHREEDHIAREPDAEADGPTESLVNRLADPRPSPEDELLADEDERLAGESVRAVRECMEHLSQRHRHILDLYFKGFSNGDIAAMLCTPRPTISNSKRRAIEAVRLCLEKRRLTRLNPPARARLS